jgi:dTDP-4-amino-4,6-dideoxygalactose transaminase
MNNAYQAVKDFEHALCDYTGAPYCVTVNSCSMALFLCCKLLKVKEVILPKFTYPSVAASVVNAGGWCEFVDKAWQKRGWYFLEPYPIIDSAKYLARGMYKGSSYLCLSFHGKKTLPIGRGGAILLDNKKHYELLKCMRFDGRHEKPLHEDKIECAGWNCYLSPEQASRGLEQMQWLSDKNLCGPDPYTDLSKYGFYKKR